MCPVRSKPAPICIIVTSSTAIIERGSAKAVLHPENEAKQMPKLFKIGKPRFSRVTFLLFLRSTCALATLIFVGFSGLLMANDCEMNETAQALLNSVNEARSQRRQCGDQNVDAAEPLSWNCKLQDAASAHSENMAEQAFFSHSGPEGAQVSDRVSSRGYIWSAVGENIAAGQNSVDKVMDGWLSSPGHCTNIMSAEFTEMGAARVEAPGSKYSPFWTQVFGRPR